MSIFKDIIAADVHSVFLNVEEFSDMHNINGVDMPVQETRMSRSSVRNALTSTWMGSI